MTNKAEPYKCWKEPLPKRSVKKQKDGTSVSNLDAKNWKFFKPGSDDFRNGLPSLFDTKDIFLESYSRMAPPVTSSDVHRARVTEGGRPNARPKTGPLNDQAVLSKRSPNMQARFDVVQRMEDGLKRHPLALYPHLEECMPPDLFEDVVEILDPEMKHAMDSGSDDNFVVYNEVSTDEAALLAESARAAENIEETAEFTSSNVNNPYLWRPQQEETDITKDKKKQAQAEQPKLRSQIQDEEILLITKAFCEWVASIGGDTNNIEEQTILSLFASGYETKPALSVPIHIVELNNIPPELRAFTTGPQPAQATTKPAHIPSKDIITTSEGFPVTSIKQKFGAWYLDPKTWQRRAADEPLKDPNDHTDEDMSDIRKKSLKLDEDLAPMHGTQLFMQFMDKRETRRPEFLENVSRIQAQQLAEERLRQEAEKTKLRKLLARQTSQK